VLGMVMGRRALGPSGFASVPGAVTVAAAADAAYEAYKAKVWYDAENEDDDEEVSGQGGGGAGT